MQRQEVTRVTNKAGQGSALGHTHEPGESGRMQREGKGLPLWGEEPDGWAPGKGEWLSFH